MEGDGVVSSFGPLQVDGGCVGKVKNEVREGKEDSGGSNKGAALEFGMFKHVLLENQINSID